MPKPAERSYSRSSIEALELLGQLIRAGRIERKMTTQALAQRAGISRALLYRIEHGDPACTIGAVFETATIVGVPLFEPPVNANLFGRDARAGQLRDVSSQLALLPKRVRARAKALKDDF